MWTCRSYSACLRVDSGVRFLSLCMQAARKAAVAAKEAAAAKLVAQQEEESKPRSAPQAPSSGKKQSKKQSKAAQVNISICNQYTVLVLGSIGVDAAAG